LDSILKKKFPLPPDGYRAFSSGAGIKAGSFIFLG